MDSHQSSNARIQGLIQELELAEINIQKTV